MMETDICILGAGFAGIGAGEAAHESGRETVLIEQMSTWGGFALHSKCRAFALIRQYICHLRKIL